MKIENRELHNLYQYVKKDIGAYGLYIEGFTGGITVYATDSSALYRKTFHGDNKTQFCSYIGGLTAVSEKLKRACKRLKFEPYWNPINDKNGVTDTGDFEKMNRINGDQAAQKICDFHKLFELEKYKAFSVNLKEFRQAVKGVDVINKCEKNHNIVLSFTGGYLDIASWPESADLEDESASWQIELNTGMTGAIRVKKSYLDGIKGDKAEFAVTSGEYDKHGILYAKTDNGIETLIAPMSLDNGDKKRFLKVLEYEYTGYPKPAIAEKMAESKPEKPKNRKLRRKAPKPVRENRAFTGWTYNRLGTKQTMVCKW